MSDVIYVLDRRYFNLFKTSIYSLIKNSTVDLNIYLLCKDDEFSNEAKQRILDFFSSIRNNVSVSFVRSKLYYSWKERGVFYKSEWYDDSIFLKACIGDAAPESVDWITYIDSDTLVVKNIDKYLLETYPMPLAGVIDINFDLDTEYGYFSSASYKTSLNYWRENGIQEKIDSMIDKGHRYVDQDILNEIFLHNKTFLPLKYNVDHRYVDSLSIMRSLHHTSIIHFGGPTKPDSHLYQSNPWQNKWKLYNKEVQGLSI
jgi:lipopolysaccharide biosynthesis glycosyltransferase